MEVEKNENFEFIVNHRHFMTSIVALLDLIKDRADEIKDNNPKKSKYFNKLYKTTDKILNHYRNNTDNFDENKIIKKVYKTLRDHANLLKYKDR